jgi:hypothetical protein
MQMWTPGSISRQVRDAGLAGRVVDGRQCVVLVKGVLRIVNLVGSGVVQPAPSCGQGWQSARA